MHNENASESYAEGSVFNGREVEMSVKSSKKWNRVDGVENLPDAARMCRAFSHNWKAYTAPPVEKRKKILGFNVTLICERGCGTFKHFFLSQRGEYGRPHYTYNREYLLTHPLTAEERNQLRYQVLVDTGIIPS